MLKWWNSVIKCTPPSWRLEGIQTELSVMTLDSTVIAWNWSKFYSSNLQKPLMEASIKLAPEREANIFVSCQPRYRNTGAALILTWLTTQCIQEKSSWNQSVLWSWTSTRTGLWYQNTRCQNGHGTLNWDAQLPIRFTGSTKLTSLVKDKTNRTLLTEFQTRGFRIPTRATKYEKFNVFTFQTAFNDGTLGVLASMP